jgi:uncharacterized protein
MNRWQAATILVLLLLPLAVFVGVASWALWEAGHLLWMWAILPVSWGLAFLLARWWRTSVLPLAPPRSDPPLHWTPRDREAWRLVEERSAQAEKIPPARLSELRFYFDTARDLALDVARLYHPQAADPVSSLTVPEILAAAELAFEDLAGMVERYVPGSHLLTVRHWRMLGKLPGLTRTFSKLYWPISALVSPHTVVGRYAASRWLTEPVARTLQTNVLAWFYAAFVQRVGYYAIELNSGRLRGGAARFRKVKGGRGADAAGGEAAAAGNKPGATAGAAGGTGGSQAGAERGRTGEARVDKPPVSPRPPVSPYPPAAASGPAAGPREPSVSAVPEATPPAAQTELATTLCLVGQTGAGKSSLINVLLGEQRAETDVLPNTRTVTRYKLRLDAPPVRLELLDTPGYGVDDPGDQLSETLTAMRQSDLTLLVVDGTSPAREADLEMLRGVREWFRSQPHLKPPAVLAVMTHADLLSPAREWSPPYDLVRGTTSKARAIRGALEYQREQLAEFIAGAVAVASDSAGGRVWGITEHLLPAASELLDEAHATALLRALHAEQDRGQFQRLARQVWNVGRALLKGGLSDQGTRN